MCEVLPRFSSALTGECRFFPGALVRCGVRLYLDNLPLIELCAGAGARPTRGKPMSIDKSLRRRNQLARARNVLTRGERIRVLQDEERWQEGRSPFGLPKVRVIKVAVKKKKAKEEEKPAEEAAPAAEA